MGAYDEWGAVPALTFGMRPEGFSIHASRGRIMGGSAVRETSLSSLIVPGSAKCRERLGAMDNCKLKMGAPFPVGRCFTLEAAQLTNALGAKGAGEDGVVAGPTTSRSGCELTVLRSRTILLLG